MFRHPLSEEQAPIQGGFDGQPTVEEWVRHYRVPGTKEKKDVLNMVLFRLEQQSAAKNIPHKKQIRLFPTLVWLSAASIVIAFLLLFEHNSQTFTYSETECAFFLPDQSRLILNHNSSVRYSETLWGRRVRLEGTGYFEVTKGGRFTVQTPGGKVQVLGTRFSVYEKNNGLLIECYEGKVSYQQNLHSQHIVAGQKLEVDKNKIQHPQSISTKYPDLAYYSKAYDKANMEEVLADIEQFFGLDIELEGVEQPLHFTGRISNPRVDTLLSILCIPFQLEYSFVDPQKILIKPVR